MSKTEARDSERDTLSVAKETPQATASTSPMEGPGKRSAQEMEAQLDQMPTQEPKSVEIDLENTERRPISVSKLGKMKKRDPNKQITTEHVPARRPRSRSPSPGRRIFRDETSTPVLSEHNERQFSPELARNKRSSPPPEPSVKRQKRPGVRRDPAEAEAERLETIRRQQESDRKAREAANLRNQYHRGSEVVRSHYNARPNQGREQRNQSPIVNLRNFNNWIKSTLIRNFTPNPRDKRVSVLDLGCGKGGDLMKWDKADVSSYTGIDLAEVSIDQARGRYQRMRNARFHADFYAFDCFGLPLTQLLPPDKRMFDMVSMQFCLHYAFESEAKVRQMLSNVACALPRGGKFLGTIPSSDAIISHIKKLPAGVKEWGNEIYKVEFEHPPPPGPDVVFRPPFGHKYTFYLKDAVDIVPEYVVPFNAFRAIAEEYNLELLYHKGFHEVFDENCDDFDGGMLLDRMGVVKKDGTRGIEGDEREACGFYAAFCFEKRGAK